MEKTHISYISESTNRSVRVPRDTVWTGYFIITATTSLQLDLDILLSGRNARAFIYILVFGSAPHADIEVRTKQRHGEPDTASTLLLASVLGGNAFLSFDGTISVSPDAMRTDAYQRNTNILLSETARVVSRPTLEIAADDVRCTHGAATSALPEEQLWYLAARGISHKSAKRLLVEGFFRKSLERESNERMREKILHRIMGAYEKTHTEN